MAALQVTEGTANFKVPSAGKPCVTWYRVFGDISAGSRAPTILVHGGPAWSHHYLEPAARQLTARFDIPTIVYDQLGCGQSTRLPGKSSSGEGFWTVELFVDELRNLIQHLGLQRYRIVGHFTGGLVAAAFAKHKPQGLETLVLISTPTDMGLYADCLQKFLANLPDHQGGNAARQAIYPYRDHPADSQAYQLAYTTFLKNFVCRTFTVPDALQQSLDRLRDDPTVFNVMNGPHDLLAIPGSLKDYSAVDGLEGISVPTLLLNGQYDKVHYTAMNGYFWMIQKVKWVQIPESSHLPWFEAEERFYEVIEDFFED